MEKLLTVLSAAFWTLLLLSCSSVKTESVPQDSYDSTSIPSAQIIPSSSEKRSKISDPDPYNEKKIKGKKTFGQQLLGTEKYIKIDSSSLFIRNTFGQVQQRPITFIYKPQTDLAGFMVQYDTTIYCLYMAQEDRYQLIKAVNSYLSDFSEKKLVRKTAKTVKIYGEVNAYEEFGIVTTMMPNISKPEIYLGYRFLDSSPYFSFRVRKATNVAENLGSDKVPESIEQYYYLTKAQAQALAEFLSDENVTKIATSYENEHSTVPQNKDSY